MISLETLEKLSRQYQMGVFPNIVREYFQHIFLTELYKLPDAEKLLFKGGTALRIVYDSPRFSEDLDFSLFGGLDHDVKSFVEGLFIKTLAEIEKMGIHVTLGERFGATSGGYLGIFTFQMFDHQPIGVEINISTRSDVIIKGEVDSVANNFVPTYTIILLPQNDLVEEKIFGALLERKKPRDFYDLYFMMRKGIISNEQKKKLAGVKNKILTDVKNINFRGELGTFLPIDQQAIIKDFPVMLERELGRQLSGI